MDYKKCFADLILEQLGSDFNFQEIYDLIEIPPKIDLGNFSFPCFFLSKSLKKSPVVISNNLSENIFSYIFSFKSLNGYLNATINSSILVKNVISEILNKKKDFGKSDFGKNKSFVIDTFQPNPLKMLHIGHIRNGVVGESICRLLKFTGFDPRPVSYMGDVGTHIAKWLWYYDNFLAENKKLIPEKDKSKWFGNIYILAGEKILENKDLYKAQVESYQIQLIKNINLQNRLKLFIDSSFNGYMEVAKELDINLCFNFFESQSEKKFNEIKEGLFNKYNYIFKEDQGAIVADLNDKHLGNFIIIKSNHALLYGAKDIGLINLKKEKFKDCNNFLYIVASEQEFYFEQLFKLFKIIYPNLDNKHISHGLVNTPEGKMKSRSGSLFLYEDFRDALFEKVNFVLDQNGLDKDSQVIKDISFGTIKFELLKNSIFKTIVFDINKSTDLNGDSSAYVQYSGVRAKSILDKSNFNNFNTDFLFLKDDFEKEELLLINKLNEFKEKVIYASKDFKPNIIANYVIELSHIFNKFYNSCHVLCNNKSISTNRLLFTKAFYIVLENALYLLGINIPSKM
ncbi:MAG: arginine--tRNA ligase [Candidatus ainarchaeum sp.]|nr:arginine--tRNA ligase [Candidatus ainarchaeum sp.]